MVIVASAINDVVEATHLTLVVLHDDYAPSISCDCFNGCTSGRTDIATSYLTNVVATAVNDSRRESFEFVADG